MDIIKGFSVTPNGIELGDSMDYYMNEYASLTLGDPLRFWITRFLDFEAKNGSTMDGIIENKVIPQAPAPAPVMGAGFKSKYEQMWAPSSELKPTNVAPQKQMKMKYVKW
jgi:hypothetical protein